MDKLTALVSGLLFGAGLAFLVLRSRPASHPARHLPQDPEEGQRHQLTPFELVTAAAFCAFAEAGCELVVLEGSANHI